MTSASRMSTGGKKEITVKLRNFFKSFWRKAAKAKNSPDPPQPAMMQKMIMGLAHTQAQELSCDEVYALLDVFADKVSRGEDAASLMPLVQRHLEMCPDCREEFEALVKSMQATNSDTA